MTDMDGKVGTDGPDEEKRFSFGENWQNFVSQLDEERIKIAEQSLTDKVGPLKGKTFLDLGSGSGLFSLAAHRLGAKVVSVDYDAKSVECTRQLRERYAQGVADWDVMRGDALDAEMLRPLGTFDVVYSWGVLHHTGDMWRAMENASALIAPGGQFFVAIYNDQGGTSRRWLAVKKLYISLPEVGRTALCLAVGLMWETRLLVARVINGINPLPWVHWRQKKKTRGMSVWHDIRDWVGGYPFEVAKPEEIFEFCKERGFLLEHLTTCGGGLGCNEFVFSRPDPS
ncbi:MAG: class I SAM-dependent methyltransferase [Pseudodesulfovibrio sp.]